MLISGERLRPLRGGVLVLEGEWLRFDVLSEALAEWRRGSLWRGVALRFRTGLWGARLWGERFSLPEEASLDGDLPGRLSRTASGRLGLSLRGDLDWRGALSRFELSSCWEEERLSERLLFCSPLMLEGEWDFLVLSLDLSVLSARFLSLDLLLARPLSFTAMSLVVLVILSLVSLVCSSLFPDLLLLRLRCLALVLPPSIESLLAFPLFPFLGDAGLPELLWCCSPFRTRASPSSSEPELYPWRIKPIPDWTFPSISWLSNSALIKALCFSKSSNKALSSKLGFPEEGEESAFLWLEELRMIAAEGEEPSLRLCFLCLWRCFRFRSLSSSEACLCFLCLLRCLCFFLLCLPLPPWCLGPSSVFSPLFTASSYVNEIRNKLAGYADTPPL